jgi:hypothetical protein
MFPVTIPTAGVMVAPVQVHVMWVAAVERAISAAATARDHATAVVRDQAIPAHLAV